MDIVSAKDFEVLSPLFKGERGHRYAEFFMRIFSIEKLNKVYSNLCQYSGAEFAAKLLDDFGVHYLIGNAERLKHLPEKAFITISNHPYGGLDGIIMIDLMARIRPDYKFMVNKILSLVKPMKENFISVTPTGNKLKGITRTSLQGVRETIHRLQSNHPVGFFLSGAVSDLSLRDLCIRDRKWQKSILHLIRTAKVPILPIRFFDKNSPFFYFLGLINWRIRTLRMPAELFNKEGKKTRIGIGNIISVQEQEQFDNSESLGMFLRKAVYEMPVPSSFTPRDMLTLRENPFDLSSNGYVNLQV